MIHEVFLRDSVVPKPASWEIDGIYFARKID